MCSVQLLYRRIHSLISISLVSKLLYIRHNNKIIIILTKVIKVKCYFMWNLTSTPSICDAVYVHVYLCLTKACHPDVAGNVDSDPVVPLFSSEIVIPHKHHLHPPSPLLRLVSAQTYQGLRQCKTYD